MRRKKMTPLNIEKKLEQIELRVIELLEENKRLREENEKIEKTSKNDFVGSPTIKENSMP